MRMTKFWRLSVSQNNIGSGDMMKPLVIPRYFWRATAEKNYHLLASVPLHFSPCCAPDNHYLLLPNRSLPSPSSSSTPGLPETVNPRPHPQTPSSPVFCERLLSWFSCELLAKVFFCCCSHYQLTSFPLSKRECSSKLLGPCLASVRLPALRNSSSQQYHYKLFIYFWLLWVFVAVLGLSLVAASRGYFSLRCTGFSSRLFSCCRA